MRPFSRPVRPKKTGDNSKKPIFPQGKPVNYMTYSTGLASNTIGQKKSESTMMEMGVGEGNSKR